MLRNPPPLDSLGNSGFEQPSTAGSPIPSWSVIQQNKTSVQLDRTQKHSGTQSVKLSSEGPIVCLLSQPLAAPATGRLAMSVWLRVADAARQPPLRLAIEGKLHGRDYYKIRSGRFGGECRPAGGRDRGRLGNVHFSSRRLTP